MRFRNYIRAAAAAVCLWGGLFAFQQVGFRVPTDYDNDGAPIPPDANEKTEWAFARLKYPSWGRRWYSSRSWMVDYPKADRQFVQGVRRLTRIHTCAGERVIDLDTDEIFYWPWVYVVEPGQWRLTDEQAARLREYMLRGGFLFFDDFHGTREWQIFEAGIARIFPDRQIVDIADTDEIFHVLYDMDERVQVPGIQYWYSGRTWERDGIDPKWRGIYDDKGRLMMAIHHNMDLGDAWEWADHPSYPEAWASQAYRTGINSIIYAMTH
ncbi:MAG: DUF4159 domain-containing protein [bacterium]|jgi:hypothetical protein